jgi:hypothetical protein
MALPPWSRIEPPSRCLWSHAPVVPSSRWGGGDVVLFGLLLSSSPPGEGSGACGPRWGVLDSCSVQRGLQEGCRKEGA